MGFGNISQGQKHPRLVASKHNVALASGQANEGIKQAEHSLGKWQSIMPRAEAHEEVRLGKWHLSVQSAIESLVASLQRGLASTEAFAQLFQKDERAQSRFLRDHRYPDTQN